MNSHAEPPSARHRLATQCVAQKIFQSLEKGVPVFGLVYRDTKGDRHLRGGFLGQKTIVHLSGVQPPP